MKFDKSQDWRFYIWAIKDFIIHKDQIHYPRPWMCKKVKSTKLIISQLHPSSLGEKRGLLLQRNELWFLFRITFVFSGNFFASFSLKVAVDFILVADLWNQRSVFPWCFGVGQPNPFAKVVNLVNGFTKFVDPFDIRVTYTWNEKYLSKDKGCFLFSLYNDNSFERFSNGNAITYDSFHFLIFFI